MTEPAPMLPELLQRHTLQTRAADAVFWSVEKSFLGGLAAVAAFLVVLSVRWLRN